MSGSILIFAELFLFSQSCGEHLSSDTDGWLDLCAVKHLRLPEPLRVVLDLLLGQGHQIPILASAHDVKDTGNDVAAHPARS